LIQDLLCHLDSTFTIKDLGSLSYFLGIEITSLDMGLHLSQTCYIQDLIVQAKMDGAKPISTPMASGLQLSALDGDPMNDPSLYRSIIGDLQYAIIIRPYISFAVNRVSLFMHSPREPH
jgi:Reverse transcriptase (RNA-dependent DNA polymerase)